MRFYFLLAVLLVAAIIGQMSRADLAPCSSEEADLTRIEGQLAESMTLRLSLKSQLETEMVTRTERLTPVLKDAADNMDRAGRSAWQDQQIFENIVALKGSVEQMLGDKSALEKLDVAVTALLLQPPVRPFSKCVFEVAQGAKSENLLRFSDLFQRLETNRLWIDQLAAWRSELTLESRILTQALQNLTPFSERLRQRLVAGSAHLTEFKVRMREVEKQIDQSAATENRLKSQLDQVEKRVSMLKAALPDLRTRLNRCTRRAQFGN